MFHKSTLLALALSLLVAASPTSFRPRKRSNEAVNIHFHGRRSLTQENGVFNGNAAEKNAQMTIGKHIRNLSNIQRNVRNKRSQNAIANATDESLTVEGDDREWAGSISIGTPGAEFQVEFDTGSADLWVTSSSCTSAPCSEKNKYNPDESSTTSAQSGQFQFTYMDGLQVSGSIFSDTVNVAGVTVTDQQFGAVDQVSNDFSDDPIDGILGLAYPALGDLNSNPFFINAFQQNAVPLNLFAMKLAETGSVITLGGIEEAFVGSLEGHPVTPFSHDTLSFWHLSGASVNVNFLPTVLSFETIIDSGTSIIYGPPDQVAMLYKAVPGAAIFNSTAGLYSFPCSSVPIISFDWGGQQWSINEKDFNLGQTEPGSSDCVGAIAGRDIGLPPNVWLLGDTFLKNVYTVFSFAENAVGFGQLPLPPPPPPSTATPSPTATPA